MNTVATILSVKLQTLYREKKKKNLYISMKNKLAPGSVWKESEGRNGSITLEPSSPK